jgi:hypothetical protein
MTRMDAKFNQEKIIRANSCDSRADLFFSLIPGWNALSSTRWQIKRGFPA